MNNGEITISPDTWIVVPKWDRFQHYGDRDPIWIKVYIKLLHDPNFLDLSASSQGLLLVIWLLYAAENGQVTVKKLQRYGRKGVGYYQLISLNHAGFIALSASKPLAPNVEEETETEEESPYPLKTARANRHVKLHERLLAEAKRIAEEWNSQDSDQFASALEELERKHKSRLNFRERECLWDVAWQRDA